MSPSQKLLIRINLGNRISRIAEELHQIRAIAEMIPGSIMDDSLEETARILERVHSFNTLMLQKLENTRD